MNDHLAVIPADAIEQSIFLVRGHKVMLDFNLAALYGVETKNLNKAVRRNLSRFPPDFMFLLTPEELANLKFQIGTSSSTHGGRRKPVSAFTEQGVAMLSSVLRSSRAVQVNIAIMRTFVQLRRLLESHSELARKLEELESQYDEQFRAVFDAIRELMKRTEPPPVSEKPPGEIGFHTLLPVKSPKGRITFPKASP